MLHGCVWWSSDGKSLRIYSAYNGTQDNTWQYNMCCILQGSNSHAYIIPANKSPKLEISYAWFVCCATRGAFKSFQFWSRFHLLSLSLSWTGVRTAAKNALPFMGEDPFWPQKRVSNCMNLLHHVSTSWRRCTNGLSLQWIWSKVVLDMLPCCQIFHSKVKEAQKRKGGHWRCQDEKRSCSSLVTEGGSWWGGKTKKIKLASRATCGPQWPYIF